MKKNINVVIVGGGFGGVKTAMELANKRGFDVILISNTTNFEYHGALYRTATGRSPLEVVIPLREIFKHAKNVQVVLDEVASISPEHHQLRSSSGRVYAYDALVLAMGNTVNYFGLDGMQEKTYSANTIVQAIALRHKLTQLFKVSHSEPSIVVIGAGASGTEIAGSVLEFKRLVAHKYGARGVKPKITLIDGADRVLPMFDPVLSAKAYKRLKKMGVEIRLNTVVDACEQGKVCVKGGDINADVIVWTAGSRPVNFFAAHPKVFAFEKGRVKVDKYLRAAGHNNIFVIGDNALTPYSGMAQTAIHDAKYIARNFMRVKKRKPAVLYRAWHPIYVVPVGHRWAVFQDEKHQWSGYRAWLVRRKADLWVLKNFRPLKRAKTQWRKGNKKAQF